MPVRMKTIRGGPGGFPADNVFSKRVLKKSVK
jgi:hypothetical protein